MTGGARAVCHRATAAQRSGGQLVDTVAPKNIWGTGTTKAAVEQQEDRLWALAATPGWTFTIFSIMARGRGFGDWWVETSGTLMPRNTRNSANTMAVTHQEKCLRMKYGSIFIADSLHHVYHNLNNALDKYEVFNVVCYSECTFYRKGRS